MLSHDLVTCDTNINKTKRHDNVIEMPIGVWLAVFSTSSGSIFMWLYPLEQFIQENIKCLAVAASNRMCTLSKETSSSKHAMLKARKSIQQRNCPFFSSQHNLASQVECWTGLIKPTSDNFWISSLIYTSSFRLESSMPIWWAWFLLEYWVDAWPTVD